MAMRKTLLLAALLALAPCAAAQEWDGEADPQLLARMEAQAEAHRGYILRLADALAASGGARELAYAALLRRQALEPAPEEQMPGGDAPSTRVPGDAQAARWLRAAAAKAGGDVLANQLLIAAADDGDAALRAEAARRWQAADPGNLVPLLHGGLPVDAMLVEARRARHVDSRAYDLVRWAMQVHARRPPTAAERAALAPDGRYSPEVVAAGGMMARWAAVAMPVPVVLQACRGDALRASPTRPADCRHVAGLLVDRSTTLADRLVGLDIQRALAAGAGERAQVDALRRRLDWQAMEWGRVSAAQPDGGIAQFVRLLSDPAVTGEQQLMERVLREAGVPLEPPPGWSPPGRR